MKKITLLFTVLLFGLLLIFCYESCGPEKKKPPVYNPEFDNYISGYTSGVISKTSSIRIRLVNEVDSMQINKGIVEDLFYFEPDISGKSSWFDNRTIIFRPDEMLESGTVYNAGFKLGNVIKVPDDLKVFEFQFQTIKLSFQFYNNGIKTYENDQNYVWLSGSIISSDVMENDKVEKIIRAEVDKLQAPIKWDHKDDGIIHDFRIDSIRRIAESREVTISWNGSPYGIDLKGSENIEIPSISEFKILDVTVNHDPGQEIVIKFSDPLLKSQNLEGLVRLKYGSELQLIVDNNEIRAFPKEREEGSATLLISGGIKNIFDKKLEESYNTIISFEELKPQVEIIGSGVILPASEGLVLPFKAVNLKAVDVEIVEIFENNIGQFLQENEMDRDYQIRRVGRPVVRKTIKLESGKKLNYKKWNTFSLDLTDLVEKDMGAMYRVEFRFNRGYSLYSCNGETADETDISDEWDTSDEDKYWDGELYYYSYYPDDYDWRERNNPCDVSYYTSQRFRSINLLASDLGIIAKEGANNIMTFAVTNILSTKPEAGVEIELYNFQQQLIGKSKTDEKGLANVDLKNKPYYLKAKKGNQYGYLRLDDGTSLSMSKFDVSGAEVKEGLKGYIYGDRGVWRPGDSLYLVFVLEDKNKVLPEEHPVIFELINPFGQVIQQKIKKEGMDDFYNYSTVTEDDAPTGNWLAKVKVGGAVFTKRIKIETVKPNRLKIDLDFGTDLFTAAQLKTSGTLKASWLTGAVARNLKAIVNTDFKSVKTDFENYSNYIFDDPAKYFYSIEKTIFEGKINNQGEAVVNIELPDTKSSPGMLLANFNVRVFEEGGDYSIDNFSVSYAPYLSFVGLNMPVSENRWGDYMSGKKYAVDVVTLNYKGDPVSIDNLKAKIFKVNWRWWWDAGDDELASYFSSTVRTPVMTKEFSTTDGRGNFEFAIEKNEWGRYFLRIVNEKSGHSTGKVFYVSYPGWYAQSAAQSADGATVLILTADKEKYEVGDQCTVTFPSGGAGRALVSIESGSEVVENFWVSTQKEQTKFTFAVTPEMAPAVYVNVSLIQPHTQTTNNLPIRLYGVIPVPVEDHETILHPVIKMPDELKPEEEFDITVSERNNRAMTYTIAIVDEGLLDLTHFKTPNPWNSFYAREALGVKTWDMYKYVIGAYGGSVEQMFAIGGDAEITDISEQKVNRFKPVVKFLGPFRYSGTNQTYGITMPNYIGSVRTMLVAGSDGAYGSTEKTTPVRKSLMVMATMPRVLGPEEEVVLPVTVFSMNDNIKNVDVTVEVNEYFDIAGNKKFVSFNQTGDKVVYFKLKVKPETGVGKIKVKAESRKEVSITEVELQIRNPNPPLTKTLSGIIEPGETWEKDYVLPGMKGTNNAVLEISGIPPVDLHKRLDYLVRYPYGCAEQVTSSVFPQLYLGYFTEISNSKEKNIEKNIMEAVNRLKSFQLTNGGISFWPGGTHASDWVTSYVGHFMLEAEKKGYNLPIGFRDEWVNYQKTASKNWSPYYTDYRGYYRQSDYVQAYRLFTLALAGEPDLGAMNRLREMNKPTLQSQWMLAAAYVLVGQKEIAEDLIKKLSYDISDYKLMSGSYGSSLRDQAVILQTLSLMNEKNKAIPVMKKIAQQLSSDKWLSTQTTAFCLVALSEFIGKEEIQDKPVEFEYVVNKQDTEEIRSHKPMYQLEIPCMNNNGYVSVTNKGENEIYTQITMTGIPVTGDTTSAENNLNMQIEYRDMNGDKIEVDRLMQGVDFMAVVTITNPGLLGDYKNMVLSQNIASGWEINNTRLYDFNVNVNADKPTYQDIRDDRVNTFFDIDAGKRKIFVVLLNAAYLGKFYLPSVSCEAMYDNTINARIPGKWVEVYQPGE